MLFLLNPEVIRVFRTLSKANREAFAGWLVKRQRDLDKPTSINVKVSRETQGRAEWKEGEDQGGRQEKEEQKEGKDEKEKCGRKKAMPAAAVRERGEKTSGGATSGVSNRFGSASNTDSRSSNNGELFVSRGFEVVRVGGVGGCSDDIDSKEGGGLGQRGGGAEKEDPGPESRKNSSGINKSGEEAGDVGVSQGGKSGEGEGEGEGSAGSDIIGVDGCDVSSGVTSTTAPSSCSSCSSFSSCASSSARSIGQPLSDQQSSEVAPTNFVFGDIDNMNDEGRGSSTVSVTDGCRWRLF